MWIDKSSLADNVESEVNKLLSEYWYDRKIKVELHQILECITIDPHMAAKEFTNYRRYTIDQLDGILQMEEAFNFVRSFLPPRIHEWYLPDTNNYIDEIDELYETRKFSEKNNLDTILIKWELYEIYETFIKIYFLN